MNSGQLNATNESHAQDVKILVRELIKGRWKTTYKTESEEELRRRVRREASSFLKATGTDLWFDSRSNNIIEVRHRAYYDWKQLIVYYPNAVWIGVL